MNKKPVSYMQTDPRWKNHPYRVTGENSTVGGSGCGPSCAAMLIETLTGKTFTPLDACKWSMRHGYKALGQGTFYGYFEPQFAAFGLDCKMLNWTNTYGKPGHPNHEAVVQKLKEGYYAIACMGKGLWTNSGHFVVLWWQDGKVRINDPASTKASRLNGEIDVFRSQVKYYWLIDARKHNKNGERKDDFDMDIKEAQAKMTDCNGTGDKPSGWAKEATQWAKENGVFGGDGEGNFGWQQPITREAVAQICYNIFGPGGLMEKMKG